MTDNPSTAVPEESEGEENVEQTQEQKDALELTKLNSELGTNYGTIDDAIKGLKETKSFVGRKDSHAESQAIERLVQEGYVSKEQYEADMFYTRKPELEPYKDIINSRAKELGKRPAEVVESDESLKSTLEKLIGFDTAEKEKSVLMSNNRLGDTSNKMEQSKESASKGDYVGAERLAVGAVLESMPKK